MLKLKITEKLKHQIIKQKNKVKDALKYVSIKMAMGNGVMI